MRRRLESDRPPSSQRQAFRSSLSAREIEETDDEQEANILIEPEDRADLNSPPPTVSPIEQDDDEEAP
jgi:hypothetical protein